MEEQECFPEKNRDEDLLEKILEEKTDEYFIRQSADWR